MGHNHHPQEETPFPTTGNALNFSFFCSLQSNRGAKHIPLQGPSRELITWAARKEISNRTVSAGTAGTGAVDEWCWWLSHRDSPSMWLTGRISGEHENVDLWGKLIPPEPASVELLGFVPFFFTYGSAFTLKLFSTIHKFHCFSHLSTLWCCKVALHQSCHLSHRGRTKPRSIWCSGDLACVLSAHRSPHTVVAPPNVCITNS